MPIDLNSLSFILPEVDAALAEEERPRVRKRLIAVRSVMEGRSLTAAAAAVGVHQTTVSQWLSKVRRSGLRSLLCNRRVLPPRMAAQQIAAARRAIQAALARPRTERTRRCLTAIRLALAGQTYEAMTHAHVTRVTINRWLKEIRRFGVRRFLGRYEQPPGQFAADLAQLHALAATEKSANVRKRILALAYVAAGVPINEAAATAALAPSTMRRVIRRFRREGSAAFRNKPIPGPRVRLAPAQIRVVQALVRENPCITASDLRDRILAELGVRYTPEGVRNMLKNQLGLVRWAGKFCRMGLRGQPRKRPVPS